MKQEQVIELAKQSGFWKKHMNTWIADSDAVSVFASLVEQATLERAASTVEKCKGPDRSSWFQVNGYLDEASWKIRNLAKDAR